MKFLSFALTTFLAAGNVQSSQRHYDVHHYALEVSLSIDGVFEAQNTITLQPFRPLSSFDLDTFGLEIQEVQINGTTAPFHVRNEASRRSGILNIQPPVPVASGKPATIVIRYKGKAQTSNEGLFMVRTNDDADRLPYFFTHFEPSSAQQFFPNHDDPSDKATSEMWVTVDSRYQVLSNGEKIEDEIFERQGQSFRRVHWKQTLPHSSYLMALAVGEFEPVQVPGDVPSTIWVLPGKSDRALFARDFTESALQWESNFLKVKYPWNKYDQVALPYFLHGGMENTSLVFMRENGLVLDEKQYFLGQPRIKGLISHELAHQWFGNLVTCETWGDIWLNEGFASYLSDEAIDAWNKNDEVEVGNAEDSFVTYFQHEDGPRAQALGGRRASAADVFDAVSYQKGAHVLRMLEALLGREAFREALRQYLTTYSFRNATSNDFFKSVSQSSRRPREVAAFQNAWLYKKGYPVVTPQYRFENGKVTVTLRQTPNRRDEKGPFVFPLTIVFNRNSTPSYRSEHTIIVNKPVTTLTFKLDAAPEWVNWNKGGTALIRIPHSALSQAEWMEATRSEKDPVWRLVAYLNLLHIFAQNEPGFSPDISRTLHEGLKSDASPYVREALLRQLNRSSQGPIPEEWATTMLQLARLPENLPDDTLGTLRVRRSATEALGRFRTPATREYLLDRIAQPRIDLNELSGLALGTAHLGDSIAVAALLGAINQQKLRGFAYYKATVGALGTVENVDILPTLQHTLKDNATNPELLREVLGRLMDNQKLKNTSEFAQWVTHVTLKDSAFDEEMRSRILRLLDDVKTTDAQAALQNISDKTTSDRLRRNASEALQQNFPPKPVKTTRK